MDIFARPNHDPSNYRTDTAPQPAGDVTWADLAAGAMHRASSASHRLGLRYREGRMPEVIDPTTTVWPAMAWPTSWSVAGFCGASGSTHGRREPVMVENVVEVLHTYRTGA